MVSKHEKRCRYARMNQGYLNMEAIFSDETESYIQPFDPRPGDAARIRLRTAAQDADGVFLCAAGGKRSPMAVVRSDALFDYYETTIVMGQEPLRYYFSVQKCGKMYFYNKRGLFDTADPDYHFRILPGFTVPDWARGAVMYQIFVDRFYNGDPTNDVVNHEYRYLGHTAKKVEWGRDVAVDLDVCNFYGGDLQGVMDKIPYLKSLGVEVIYLNPIFVSPSNHKYDAQDYDHIDPHYGKIVRDEGAALRFDSLDTQPTKYISRVTDGVNLQASDELFIALVELAHKNGLRVILDAVFNHCGSFNKWMDREGYYTGEGYAPGAYTSLTSPYRSYFLWSNEAQWPEVKAYDSWWGNDAQPKLNYEDSPELMEYIMGIARKWVSPPFNADGWRMDMAADVGRSGAFNHQFWRRFRDEVRAANPDAIVLAEHYGDPSPWLDGGEWDTVMNYDAFMEPLSWFLTGMEKHSEECRPALKNDAMAFENAMRFHMARFSVHSLQTAMNELSNHDHSRFLTRTNGMVGRLHTVGARAAEQGVDKNVMLAAVVFQMTWPGAPTVYYGDEAGMMGWTDPDDRRPYPWGQEDEDMLEAHQTLIGLRKKYPVLRTGSAAFLLNDYGFLSYGRWNEKERLVVVINNNPASKEVVLPVWKIGCGRGALTRVAATFNGRAHRSAPRYPVANGYIRLTAPGNSALVLAADAE